MNLYNVDAWKIIADMDDNSIDVIITDPLYDATINMDELRRVCSGHIIMFCNPKHRFFEPRDKDEIAYWVKATSTKNYSKHIGRFIEEILIERHGDTFNAGLHWSNYTGVYDDRILEKQIHPYEKPALLMERLILIYSNPSDLIFDPFFGSGSTLKAADKLGRRSIGCEIDPVHFENFKG